MREIVTLVSVLLALGASFVGVELVGPTLILAFAVAIFAGWLGARSAGVLFALTLSLSLFFLESGGAEEMLKEMGVNPRNFFREWSTALKIGFSLLVAGLLAFTLRRRGPTAAHAAVEAADDIEAVVTGVGRIAALLFIPLMLIIFYDVTQRQILGIDGSFIESVFYFSSTKLQELQWHLHAALFMLCLGFAYVMDSHVRIELVRDRMNPRLRVWMEMLGAALFLFAYCLIIVKFGFSFAERAFLTGEVSSAQTGLSHRWIIKAVLPVGFILLGATGVAAVLRCWVYLYGPEELRPRVDRYARTHELTPPDAPRAEIARTE